MLIFAAKGKESVPMEVKAGKGCDYANLNGGNFGHFILKYAC